MSSILQKKISPSGKKKTEDYSKNLIDLWADMGQTSNNMFCFKKKKISPFVFLYFF